MPNSQSEQSSHVNIFILITGHEAFSSLVEVAAQQPSLPVPHKDDPKRSNIPVSEPALHHDIRYHPQIGKII